MVSAMVAASITPVLRDVSEVRARIIGIDGNGTGREGVLQRHGKQLDDLDEGQVFIIEKLDEITDQLKTITTGQETWSKKKFWNLVRWGIPVIISLIVLLLTYVGIRAANNKPIASTHTVSQNYPINATAE